MIWKIIHNDAKLRQKFEEIIFRKYNIVTTTFQAGPEKGSNPLHPPRKATFTPLKNFYKGKLPFSEGGGV